MICPLILKQTKKGENGLEEWERQPCLEEACSLFFGKKKKCSLFHNSEAAQEMRTILERADFVSSFQVLKSGIDNLHEEVLQKIRAQQEDRQEKQELLLEQVQGLTGELSRSIREDLSERIQTVQEEFESLPGKLEGTMQTLQERLDSLEEKISAQVTEGRQEIRDLKSLLGERLEGMENDVQKLLRQGTDLSYGITAEHRAGEQKMETRMGETRQLLSDLLAGDREIQSYYSEQKRRAEEEGLRRDKESARDQNNRGVVYFHRGAYDAAVRAFEKAVEQDPEYAEAYNNLGLAYTELKRSDHAVQAFDKALSLRPDLAETYNNLGLLYYSSLDYEKATEMFSKALEDGCKDRSMAYTNFGNSLYQLKRYEQAAAAWNKALQFNPLNQGAKKGLTLLKQEEQEVL